MKKIQRDKETKRQRETKREKQRKKERDREIERDRERWREMERDRGHCHGKKTKCSLCFNSTRAVLYFDILPRKNQQTTQEKHL